MELNMIECETAERDVDEQAMCVCKGGPTLDILQEVHRIYEERLEKIESLGGPLMLKRQVGVLQAWVSDLLAQNALLTRAVQSLEQDATAGVLLERRRHREETAELRAEAAALRRRLARKDSDLRGLVEVLRRLREFDYCTTDGIHFFEITDSDIFGPVGLAPSPKYQTNLECGDDERSKRTQYRSKPSRRFRVSGQKKKVCEKVTELKILNDTLQKENVNKDREIRRLNKDMQQYEQTIINLRNEMCSHYSGDIPKKDAQVMAGMCCVGRERGDEGELEPVKDCGAPAAYSARLPDSQGALKNGSGASVRALRADNAALGEELASARRVCVALKAQWRAAELSSRFKDEIIREMRRQLSQAKAKCKSTGTNTLPAPEPFTSALRFASTEVTGQTSFAVKAASGARNQESSAVKLASGTRNQESSAVQTASGFRNQESLSVKATICESAQSTKEKSGAKSGTCPCGGAGPGRGQCACGAAPGRLDTSGERHSPPIVTAEGSEGAGAGRAGVTGGAGCIFPGVPNLMEHFKALQEEKDKRKCLGTCIKPPEKKGKPTKFHRRRPIRVEASAGKSRPGSVERVRNIFDGKCNRSCTKSPKANVAQDKTMLSDKPMKKPPEKKPIEKKTPENKSIKDKNDTRTEGNKNEKTVLGGNFKQKCINASVLTRDTNGQSKATTKQDITDELSSSDPKCPNLVCPGLRGVGPCPTLTGLKDSASSLDEDAMVQDQKLKDAGIIRCRLPKCWSSKPSQSKSKQVADASAQDKDDSSCYNTSCPAMKGVGECPSTIGEEDREAGADGSGGNDLTESATDLYEPPSCSILLQEDSLASKATLDIDPEGISWFNRCGKKCPGTKDSEVKCSVLETLGRKARKRIISSEPIGPDILGARSIGQCRQKCPSITMRNTKEAIRDDNKDDDSEKDYKSFSKVLKPSKEVVSENKSPRYSVQNQFMCPSMQLDKNCSKSCVKNSKPRRFFQRSKDSEKKDQVRGCKCLEEMLRREKMAETRKDATDTAEEQFQDAFDFEDGVMIKPPPESTPEEEPAITPVRRTTKTLSTIIDEFKDAELHDGETEVQPISSEPESYDASGVESHPSESEPYKTDPEPYLSEPESRPSEPEINQSEPESRPSEPEVNQSEPEAHTSDPEYRLPEPESRPSALESHSSDPESRPSEPEQLSEGTGKGRTVSNVGVTSSRQDATTDTDENSRKPCKCSCYDKTDTLKSSEKLTGSSKELTAATDETSDRTHKDVGTDTEDTNQTHSRCGCVNYKRGPPVELVSKNVSAKSSRNDDLSAEVMDQEKKPSETEMEGVVLICNREPSACVPSSSSTAKIKKEAGTDPKTSRHSSLSASSQRSIERKIKTESPAASVHKIRASMQERLSSKTHHPDKKDILTYTHESPKHSKISQQKLSDNVGSLQTSEHEIQASKQSIHPSKPGQHSSKQEMRSSGHATHPSDRQINVSKQSIHTSEQETQLSEHGTYSSLQVIQSSKQGVYSTELGKQTSKHDKHPILQRILSSEEVFPIKHERASVKSEQEGSKYDIMKEISEQIQVSQPQDAKGEDVTKTDGIDDKNYVFANSPSYIVDSGAASGADSCAAGGACGAARAHYYHNKLLATLQILRNKEETVRIQSDSLRVAEARIEALAARARRNQSGDKKQPTTDAGVAVAGRDEESQALRAAVRALQDQLAIMEDLYKDCFYENARQEELIEGLRASCREIRGAGACGACGTCGESGGAGGQGGREALCRKLAAEVESLKIEICDFLNSSNNNDSGVWEASEASAELLDIMQQLRLLQRVLREQCTCGLDAENCVLKEQKQAMQDEIAMLRKEIGELQVQAIENDNLIMEYKQLLEQKEIENKNMNVLFAENEKLKEQNAAMMEDIHRLHQKINRLQEETRHNKIDGQLLQRSQEIEQKEKEEIERLRQDIFELERNAIEKDNELLEYKELIEQNESELQSDKMPKNRVTHVREDSEEFLKKQLEELRDLLKQKTHDWMECQQYCRTQEQAVKELQEKLQGMQRARGGTGQDTDFNELLNENKGLIEKNNIMQEELDRLRLNADKMTSETRHSKKDKLFDGSRQIEQREKEEIDRLRSEINKLESQIIKKDLTLLQYRQQIEQKDAELIEAVKKTTKARVKHKDFDNDALMKKQLEELRDLLQLKTRDLMQCQQYCRTQEQAVKELQGKLRERPGDDKKKDKISFKVVDDEDVPSRVVRKQLEQCQASLEAARSAAAADAARRAQLEAAVRALRDKNARFKEIIRNLCKGEVPATAVAGKPEYTDANIEILRDKIQRLEDSLAERNEQLSAAERASRDQAETSTQLRAKLQRLHALVTNLRKEKVLSTDKRYSHDGHHEQLRCQLLDIQALLEEKTRESEETRRSQDEVIRTLRDKLDKSHEMIANMTDGRLLNVQLPNVGRRETQLSQIILKNQLNEVQAHLDRKTAEVEELKQKLSKSQDVIATLTGTHLTESQDSIKSRHDSSQGSRHTARSSSPAHELHNVKRPTIDNSTSTTSLSDDDSIEALRTQLQSAQELAAARAAQLAACGEDVSRLRHERERAREAQAAAEAAHAREAARARGLERALRDERALSREKEESAALLQEQLEEAHARGAALCGEARRVVAGVRRGARELQDRNKRQEETICKLRARLAEETGQSESDAPRASETACCSNCTAGRPKLSESGRCLSERTQLMHCTFKGLRRAGSSASEIASCSSAPVARRAHCDTRACPCISWCERRPHVTTLQREVSVEELLERVESARDALQEGQRRWTRPRRE